MKRYITLALCALTVFGLGSCNKVHEEDIDSPIRTVTFQAQLGGDTRTGLALKFVPDWRETNLADVHIYEINGDERIEGEDVEMDIPGASEGNYEIALFKADFSNMTIIVNPPSNNAPRTRANEVYQYTSIVASQDGNKKFTVPATQHPTTLTLIDPHADFIVGTSLQDFSDTQAGKQVNLKFVRPVAISRLSIMNVEDAAIKQVKIYSSDKLTGSAAYDDVNFEDGTVAFDNSGSNVLTLDYGTGVAMPAEGIFNAYFVSLTGTKRITKIEVVTNAQTLTKEFAGGKALTFKVPDFKSIAVNMAGSGSSEPGPGDPLPQNISFTKAGSAIEADSFDLYTGDTYVSPTVTGAAAGATLTYESSDVAVATVSAAGVVTPQGVGETTISVVASAVEGYLAGNAEYVLTVTDSTPEAVDQSLAFMKGGSAITSDEFDLYNGGTYVSPTLTGVADGATVTWEILCTPEGCATITAEGVVTPVAQGVAVVTATASAVAPLYKETTLSYTLTIKDTTPASTQTKTYYLAESLEDGEEYVVVSGNNAMTVDGTSLGVKAITISSNTFEASEGEVALWTAAEHVEYYSGTSAAGHFTLSNGGQYLQRNSNGSTQTGAIGEIPGTKKYYVWDYDGEHLYQISSASNTFYLTYDGGWKFEYRSQPNTYLYSAKAPRQAQEIAFSASAAEYDLYTESWTVAVPTLSGAQGTVTYSSSDEAVAQVSSTGAVTIPSTAKKGDTAIITASAAGNETYKAGEASYTITIVDTTPVIPGEGSVYRKVTAQSELVAGGKYLVVYDNGSSSKVFNPIVSGSTFTTSAANAVDVTISGDTITSSELDASQIELRNFDGTNKFAMWVASVERYLILRKNNQSFVADASDDGYRSTFTVNGGTVTIVRDSYNLRYSSSNNYFQVSTSSSSNMALYKLDEGGTTPDPGTDPDPDPTTPSYTKVTSITSGGTYLIVSADAGNYNHADGTKAFVGDQNGTAATVNNAAGVITGDYSAYEFVISASGSDYTLLGPNGYVTGNANSGSRYIQVNSTAGTMSLSMASDFTGTDGQVADAFYFYYTKDNSKEVLYLNSDGKFKIGGTGRKYGVYLFKKN